MTMTVGLGFQGPLGWLAVTGNGHPARYLVGGLGWTMEAGIATHKAGAGASR